MVGTIDTFFTETQKKTSPEAAKISRDAEEKEVESILGEFQQYEREKEPWLDHFQLIGEYIHGRKMDFRTQHPPGDFLNRNLFDSQGPRSLKIASSSILAMMWPQTKDKIKLTLPRSLRKKETHTTKEYYQFVTETIVDVLDNPEGGLPTSLDEFMMDDLSFGTSGIEAMPDPVSKVVYRPWGVENIWIGEGKNGFVDTIFIKNKIPASRVMKEYGIDSVSDKVKEAVKTNQVKESCTIIIAIRPRGAAKFGTGQFGKDSMPWESVHLDVDSKKIMKREGFKEVPIKVSRFWKLMRETYGRSPAMDALPDVLELNAVWESVTIAIEKLLDPPLGVLDDGSLGNTVIDTSAGALNVFNLSGRANEENPIFPLFTVGQIQEAEKLVERLDNNISNHFFIDRLLDFNNETRMTLGEAQIRNRLRNSTLGSIFSRLIAEVFNPLIKRTFNILFDNGHLGVMPGSVEQRLAEFDGEEVVTIPDEVAKLIKRGVDVYDIEYFTPALRIMQSEQAQALIEAWQFAEQIANTGPEGAPQVLDNLDEDFSIRHFVDVIGAPEQMKRTERGEAVDGMETVESIRDGRAEIKAQQLQMQQAQMMSDSVRNLGQSGFAPQAA